MSAGQSSPFTPPSKVAKARNHFSGKAAKVEIRRNVLDAIGADKACVLDAFAGDGTMYREVWRDAALCVGCDREWFKDDRLAYVADNRRLLRSIDLSPFNVFDLDSFGSPWHQVLIIAARRKVQPRERIGIVLTEGSALHLKQGGVPNALAEIAGIRNRPAGLFRWRNDIIDRAIATMAARMCCALEAQWRAERTADAAVVYIGLVLRGL